MEDAVRQLHKYRTLAETATGQIDDNAFFAVAPGESNSVAIIMKHMAGNIGSGFFCMMFVAVPSSSWSR